MSIVSIKKCADYNDNNVYSTLLDVINSSTLPPIKNKIILVKPNILSDAKPEMSVTDRKSVV